MSDRPLHGADSAEAWNPTPWVVLMEDDDGDRINVRIAAAIGRRDAYGQARDLHPYYTPLRAEEAERDHADAELQRAKDEVPAEATFDEWKRWAGIR